MEQIERLEMEQQNILSAIAAIGTMADAMTDESQKRELMYELGWLVGEISAIGGAIADTMDGEYFTDYIH